MEDQKEHGRVLVVAASNWVLTGRSDPNVLFWSERYAKWVVEHSQPVPRTVEVIWISPDADPELRASLMETSGWTEGLRGELLPVPRTAKPLKVWRCGLNILCQRLMPRWFHEHNRRDYGFLVRCGNPAPSMGVYGTEPTPIVT